MSTNLQNLLLLLARDDVQVTVADAVEAAELSDTELDWLTDVCAQVLDTEAVQERSIRQRIASIDDRMSLFDMRLNMIQDRADATLRVVGDLLDALHSDTTQQQPAEAAETVHLTALGMNRALLRQYLQQPRPVVPADQLPGQRPDLSLVKSDNQPDDTAPAS